MFIDRILSKCKFPVTVYNRRTKQEITIVSRYKDQLLCNTGTRGTGFFLNIKDLQGVDLIINKF